jgi:hypothetical protein
MKKIFLFLFLAINLFAYSQTKIRGNAYIVRNTDTLWFKLEGDTLLLYYTNDTIRFYNNTVIVDSDLYVGGLKDTSIAPLFYRRVFADMTTGRLYTDGDSCYISSFYIKYTCLHNLTSGIISSGDTIFIDTCYADTSQYSIKSDTSNIALQLGYSGNCKPAYINDAYGCDTINVHSYLNNDSAINTSKFYMIDGDTALRCENSNTYVGLNAGDKSIIPYDTYNTYVGKSAGAVDTFGMLNTYVGYSSGGLNIDDTGNVCVGYLAGYNNLTSGFIGVGYASGWHNTTGKYNSYFGYESGAAETTGNRNSAFGYFSGHNQKVGSDNCYFGCWAGIGTNVNQARNYNSIFGSYAGKSLNTGSSNIFVGYKAGFSNKAGNGNLFIGNKAGYSSMVSDNICIGDSSGYFLTTGINNTAIGEMSGFYYTKNNYNTLLGWGTDVWDTAGVGNTCVGFGAGLGDGSLNRRNYNCIFGMEAGGGLTTGSNNVFIGNKAGWGNATGNDNIYLGDSAGYNETDSNELFIDNSPTSTPLIYGDFETDRIGINNSSPDSTLTTGGGHFTGGLKVDGNIEADTVKIAIPFVDYLYIPIGWGNDGNMTGVPDMEEEIIQGTIVNASEFVRKFYSVADDTILVSCEFPDDIDVTYGIYFKLKGIITESTAPASGEGISFYMAGQSNGDSDPIASAYGSAVEWMYKNLDGHIQYDKIDTAYSGKVTITNFAAGETTMLRLYRDISDTDDDYLQPVGITGIKIRYKRILTAP